MQAAAASGFKFSYGDAEVPRLLDTLQQKKSWEQEYKAYIKVRLTLSHTAHTGVFTDLVMSGHFVHCSAMASKSVQ